jgi:transcriptional regulator with XRE-family HTH domain
MNKFAERLKELRTKTSVTQKNLAELLDVTIRTIVYYEKGEREPSIDKLLILARYFGVTVDYLVGNSDN